jgi:hypothetical protein
MGEFLFLYGLHGASKGGKHCDTQNGLKVPKLSVHELIIWQALGSFAKLREATISFVMSVCPSAWNNTTSTGGIFMEFDIWVYFENPGFMTNFREIR